MPAHNHPIQACSNYWELQSLSQTIFRPTRQKSILSQSNSGAAHLTLRPRSPAHGWVRPLLPSPQMVQLCRFAQNVKLPHRIRHKGSTPNCPLLCRALYTSALCYAHLHAGRCAGTQFACAPVHWALSVLQLGLYRLHLHRRLDNCFGRNPFCAHKTF